MARAEFSKATKREAWERSGGVCEAHGPWWGLAEGIRCTNVVSEYDHIILDANSKDNSITNCAAVCKRCHRWKTDHRDIPTAAKTRGQQDKHRGITGPKRPWGKRPMRSSVQ